MCLIMRFTAFVVVCAPTDQNLSSRMQTIQRRREGVCSPGLCCRSHQSDQFCNRGIFFRISDIEGVNQLLRSPPLLFHPPAFTSPLPTSHSPPFPSPPLEVGPLKLNLARRSEARYKLSNEVCAPA